MKTFYLTFGQKYPWRNGYCEVVAPDIETARQLVCDIFGEKWASLYSEEDWKPEFYPQGKLGETIISWPRQSNDSKNQ